jgi:hypothetical protein
MTSERGHQKRYQGPKAGRTIDTALDPDVPILIASGAVSGVEVARIRLHIRL